jgi:hypothetical protein
LTPGVLVSLDPRLGHQLQGYVTAAARCKEGLQPVSQALVLSAGSWHPCS